MRFLVSFYGLLLRYWPMKMAALLAAIILWIYVQSLQISILTFSIPVDYQNMPQHLVYKEEPPRFVTIKLKGKEDALQFNSRRLSAKVNLAAGRKGKRDYPLFFDRNQLPLGIEVTSLPKTVAVDFIQLEEVMAKVVPAFSGQLPEGFEMGKITVTPPKIKILTNEEAAAFLQEIKTQAIALDELKKDFNIKVNLNIDSNDIYSYNPSAVQVSAVIFENSKEDKKMLSIPVQVKNLDPSLSVILSQTSVHILVQGNPSEMTNLRAEGFNAEIDLFKTRLNKETKKIEPSKTDTAVVVNVSPASPTSHLSIVDISPPSILVKFFVKENLSTPSFSSAPLFQDKPKEDAKDKK